MSLLPGAQQAFDLLARVLVEPGDLVAVEEPGYPPLSFALRSLGATVVKIPLDDEGIVVGAIPEGVRVVCVTPSHQFPLGMRMSNARRGSLLAWASRMNASIIEDDYDSQYRFGGRTLEPLQTMDREGRVIYVGTFSKTMLPTLRLGFMVVPPTLRDAVRVAKYVTDWHTSLPIQAALARFIEDGHLARHIRKKRIGYEVRHDKIVAALGEGFRRGP